MNAWRKFGLPLGILAAGAMLMGLMIKFRRPPETVPPQVSLPLVRVMRLTPTNHQFVVRSQGTVAPRTEIDLVAEVTGRVLAVAPSFRTGGFFEAGEVLVQLDPKDYELALTRAQATLAQAQAALAREEAEAQAAREEWERWGQQRGEPSPLLLREPQLAQARAAVESARAGVLTAQRDLERCRVAAPFEGRVRTQRTDVGQFVNRGQVLGRIYAVDYAEVRLPLPLDDLAYLDLPIAEGQGENPSPGPPVVLSARVAGRVFEWTGRIVRTEGEIDPRTRMLHAVARVDHPYAQAGERPPLAVGLFVHAAIQGRRVEQVYRAPRKAFRADRGLVVVNRESRLRLQPVEVLRWEMDHVVFRHAFEPGDRICITPLEVVTDGMQVRVMEEAADLSASGAAPNSSVTGQQP